MVAALVLHSGNCPVCPPVTPDTSKQCGSFFSVQRLYGFRQVVQYALWHCRIINFQINARGRLLIEDRKRELVRDLYIVQKAVIPRTAQTNKTKTKQKNSKQTTKATTNQNNPNKKPNKTNRKQHPQE